MDYYELLKRLDEFESAMSRLYESFCSRFKGDSEACALFSRLMSEERGHQEMIRMEMRAVGMDPKQFGEVHFDVSTLNKAMSRLNALLELETAPSLEEALKAAMFLESSPAERMYINAAGQAGTQFARLLGYLEGWNDQHAERLKDFAARRGYISGEGPGTRAA